MQVPIYQAVATILIEPEPPKVLNIQDVTPIGAVSPSDPDFYPTQYEIMKSRPVLERAVAALNAKTQAAARRAGRCVADVVARDRHRAQAEHAAGADQDRWARIPRGRPRRPTRVANAYAKYNVELKLKGARDALTWLTEEAGRLRAKVEESSQALQNYRVKSGILGMQEQRQITAQKIMDFNKAYLEAQAQRLSLEAKLERADPDRQGSGRGRRRSSPWPTIRSSTS